MMAADQATTPDALYAAHVVPRAIYQKQWQCRLPPSLSLSPSPLFSSVLAHAFCFIERTLSTGANA